MSVSGEGGEYSSVYRGFVRDTNDPDKRGRVRCQCPAVMGEGDTANEWLGWAEVASGLGGSARNTGSVSVPVVGTPVLLMFEQGDPDFPVVVGCLAAGSSSRDTTLPNAATGVGDQDRGVVRAEDGITVPASSGSPDYPSNRVVRTPSGFQVEIDETQGSRRARVKHPSGTWMEITDPGTLVKQVVGSILCWVGSSLKVRVVGDAMLSVGGNLYLGGSEVSATKRAAHEDSMTEDHDHPITFVLTAPPGGGPVTGSIQVGLKNDLKIRSASCSPTVKIRG